MGPAAANDRRWLWVRVAIAAAATACAVVPATPTAGAAEPRPDVVLAANQPASSLTVVSPRRLDGAVADVLVRIRDGAVCSGTPIAGTPYVVTAAHCVLDADGRPEPRSVLRDGVRHRASAVLVDTRYHANPSARLDAAVLVMDAPLPGPAARLGSTLPLDGVLQVAGFQPAEPDGTLLRGSGPHDRPSPRAAERGGVVHVDSMPAGCDVPAATLVSVPDRVIVGCGLVPGASGGPLLARDGVELVLVGIVSTVTGDLAENGIVPLASLHELLAHRDVYLHHLVDRADAPAALHLR